MAKRTYAEIDKRILLRVRESPATYSEIQKRTGTNYDTVKMHCVNMRLAGLVDVSLIAEHDANGRPANLVRITPQGRSYLQRLQE